MKWSKMNCFYLLNWYLPMIYRYKPGVFIQQKLHTFPKILNSLKFLVFWNLRLKRNKFTASEMTLINNIQQYHIDCFIIWHHEHVYKTLRWSHVIGSKLMSHILSLVECSLLQQRFRNMIIYSFSVHLLYSRISFKFARVGTKLIFCSLK